MTKKLILDFYLAARFQLCFMFVNCKMIFLNHQAEINKYTKNTFISTARRNVYESRL